MGSGVQRQVTGKLIGTGADLEVRTVTFRPAKVELYNEDGVCHAVWTKTMADDAMMKTVTAGTVSVVTSNGITPLSDGFALGADTDLNVSGEAVHWVASE